MAHGRNIWRLWRRPISQEELKVQRNLSMLLVLVLLAVVTVATFRDMNVWAAPGDRESIQEGLRLMVEASNLARKYYVDDIDNKQLYEDAVQGMLHGLDPFSAFISAERLSEFQKRVKGSFGGIGIVIGMDGGWLTVISPIEDCPAFRQGIMAGDKIIEIEGKSTEGMSLDDAVKQLTGKPGTRVTFTVVHEIDLQREEFTVTREIIHIKTIKGMARDDEGHWQYIVDEANGVAYIRLTSFTEDTVDDLHAALKDARNQGMKSLVLDLRWNGGGMLDSAIRVADTFLSEGVIVATRGRNDPEESKSATHAGTITDLPMVVLVNGRSASASEIVAGALQDHNRAIVLGERTFGKGSVQRIFHLDNGRCAVKLTVAKYYLPSGRCIHRTEGDEVWGVDPLIKVPMTLEEYAAVILSRRDSEVLRVNGNGDRPGGNGKNNVVPEKDNGADPVPELKDQGSTDESPKEIAPEPAKPKVASDDDAKEPVVDRQLDRAIDVLRMLPLVKQFSNLEVAVPSK
jgi:carboxyl-terminal processing protease